MNEYCQNVLKAELAKSDYDGKTADQGWAWLMEPRTEEISKPTGIKLTPLVAAATLGPMKANALAGKILAVLPHIGAALMQDGVDLAHPATKPFLDVLVGDGITAEDIAALMALGVEITVKQFKPRFDERFFPELWPHVAKDGNIGGADDPAISGFPNTVSREDFDKAWSAAGRNA
jgi:hypothetical protein